MKTLKKYNIASKIDDMYLAKKIEHGKA